MRYIQMAPLTLEYSEWTVGLLSSKMCRRIFNQFTGCDDKPVQCSYWPENGIDWLG